MGHVNSALATVAIANHDYKVETITLVLRASYIHSTLSSLLHTLLFFG
jgi:hypothetical protein